MAKKTKKAKKPVKKTAKKRGKKPVKKKVVKVKSISKDKKVRASSRTAPKKKRFSLVVKNLILFIILFLLFLLLYNVSNNPIYQDFFWLLALILGFIALAFLILFLTLLFIRMKKK